MYEDEQTKLHTLQNRVADRIDGEVDMDLHGNISFRPLGVKRGEFDK